MIMKSSRKSKKKLKEPDSAEHGYNYAIFLLGLRLRTSGEIERKMQERGYAEKVIGEVVARLLKEGFVDDEQYAHIYIENMMNYKIYGFFMAKKKLMERRLALPLIEQKLEELFTPAQELKIAGRFLDKEIKLRGKAEKLTYEDKQKFGNKLQTRGFRGETITKALAKYSFREDA